MGLFKSARDKILSKRIVPPAAKTPSNLRSRRTGPQSATVGADGRQRSIDLQEAIARGDVPTVDRRLPYRRRPAHVVRAEQLAQQSQSPLLLETLRRRLAGDKIGGRPTAEDERRLRNLEAHAAYYAGQTPIGKRRAAIRQALQGQVGFLQRAALRTQEAGLTAAETLFGKAKDIAAKLTGKSLARKLAGFNLGALPSETALSNRLPAEEGFPRVSPYQGQREVAVSSSNVASLSWEPDDTESVVSDKTLGTMFIAFRNGWRYKYRSCPHWVYEAILRAPSKGKAVWSLVRRGLYPPGQPYGNYDTDGYTRIR